MTEQCHAHEPLQSRVSGIYHTLKPVLGEEQTWTRPLSTSAGKSSAKINRNGRAWLHPTHRGLVQGPGRILEDPSARDTDRIAPSFKLRYPTTDDCTSGSGLAGTGAVMTPFAPFLPSFSV
ncbi:hypothetical protein IG631_04796 [Alternaria alternata]|nr:hypothetical protein IG631_04796 [Alternaria alternata]